MKNKLNSKEIIYLVKCLHLNSLFNFVYNFNYIVDAAHSTLNIINKDNHNVFS